VIFRDGLPIRTITGRGESLDRGQIAQLSRSTLS
jgi:hypothetical protein